MMRTSIFGLALVALAWLQAPAFAGDSHHHHDVGDQNHHSLLEQARGLQRVHRFGEAIEVLDRYLDQSTADANVHLLYADVLRHSGQFEAARAACARVAAAGAPIVASYCAIQLLLDTEDFEKANALSDTLAGHRDRLPENVRVWALEISAEAAWRAGHTRKAQDLYSEALAMNVVPHSTTDSFREFQKAIVGDK